MKKIDPNIVITERFCNSCKTLKPINKFTRDKHEKTGYTHKCTKCRSDYYKAYYKANPEKAKLKNDKQKENRKQYYQTEEGKKSSRRAHLKRIFNMTLEDHDKMLKDQNGKCAICLGTKTFDKHGCLAVDHCHKTGKIRGLLCYKCNTALGMFDDNIEVIERAIKYIKTHNYAESQSTIND